MNQETTQLDSENFEMVAKTYMGLEEILMEELIALGAKNVEPGNRMVSFHGDKALMYKANICLRTALRILKPIEKFTAYDAENLYDIIREIDWSKYMSVDNTFAVDATVNSEEFNHSRFVTYRIKDGIADYFRDKTGRRPSVSVTDPDFLFNVHIDGDRVTISLDSSGEPLSKRGWRVDTTKAPLNEVMAAGIILKTGWRGDCDFADPMCGSGTFLVEAALIAANINPGIFRAQFGFEKWPDFDADLFEEIYNDDSAERDFNFKIYGGDIDPEAVTVARANIRNARVEDMIDLTCKPFADWTDNGDPGVLVMNPPYGERLRPENMVELYKGIGTTLKRNFAGWHAWILGLNKEDFDNIGLKPTQKIPLLNGSLECSLREYILFEGRRDDFVAAGGKTSREDSGNQIHKMRRRSDDEWNAETRRYGHDKSSKPRKNDGGFDRKGGFDKKRDDRKGGFDKRDDRKGGYERKGGFDKRDDRKGGFERKGGFDKRDDRKGGFERKGGFDRSRRSEAKTVNPKGPQISAEHETRFIPSGMRPRRRKPNTDNED